MSSQLIGYQFTLDLVGGHSKGITRGRHVRRPRGIDRCESPLEHQLALSLCKIHDFTSRRPGDHPWRVGGWQGLGVALLAQPAYGPYRPDFALVPIDWKYSKLLPVIIEVDGHEFHERTKEQAARDRARDRFMTARGSIVVRFTGTEVWRDSAACAGEALAYCSQVRISA